MLKFIFINAESTGCISLRIHINDKYIFLVFC